jgi:TonB family protein
MKHKIKIMKKTQQPSDEEIQSYMNFDRLLENRKIAVSSSRAVTVLKWVVPALIIMGTISWILLSDNVKHPAPTSMLPEQDSTTTNSKKTPTLATPDTATLGKQNENVTTRSAIQNRPSTPRAISEKASDDNRAAEAKGSAYTQAEPLHGYAELYNYFNSSLIYPPEALGDSIQGIQTISFVINMEGRPEKIEVVESLGDPFEKESRRLIENMPEWKPATLNGKPVPSKITIPLTFQIKKIKE